MSWFAEILHNLFHGLCVRNAVVEKYDSFAWLQCRKCGVTVAISFFGPDDGELHIHVCEGYKRFSSQITSTLRTEENLPLRRGISSHRKDD